LFRSDRGTVNIFEVHRVPRPKISVNKFDFTVKLANNQQEFTLLTTLNHISFKCTFGSAEIVKNQYMNTLE